jgi:hypothetical protein
MKPNTRQQTLTVGEVCYAIAQGHLPATIQDNQWYQINARELRRFANRQVEPGGHNLPRMTRSVQQ